jgi:hypothetical protein
MQVLTARTVVTATLLTVAFVIPNASAGTISAPSCSQSDVQATVDSAADGDIVAIPAGSCTWSKPVVFTSKNIHVRGAGIGQTTISGASASYIFYVHIEHPSKGSHRISDMTLQGDVTTSVIYVTSGKIAAVPSGRWRVDHIHFNFTSGQRSGIHTFGVNYGVIDHNIWTWHAGIAIRQANSLNSECGGGGDPIGGAFQNSQRWNAGSDEFLFVEDNTFTFNWSAGNSIAYDASAGGGKVVFRYNTLIGALFYNHWTRGCEFAAQVMEIYNNHWVGNSEWGNDEGYIAMLEAGTGVIYNNHVEGYRRGALNPWVGVSERRGAGTQTSGPLGPCDGSKPWDGNAGDPAAPGWPCLGQIGRAPGQGWAHLQANTAQQPSAPLYLWNNGETIGCRTGGACVDTLVVGSGSSYIKSTPHPNGEVDYVNNNTPMPGYKAYSYPHPLVAGSSVPLPTAPTNVRILPGSSNDENH